MDDERITFDINAFLKVYLDNPALVPCDNAESDLVEAEADPESLSSDQIDAVLDPIIDVVANNPEAIGRVAIFDNVICMLKYVRTPEIGSKV